MDQQEELRRQLEAIKAKERRIQEKDRQLQGKGRALQEKHEQPLEMDQNEPNWEVLMGIVTYARTMYDKEQDGINMERKHLEYSYKMLSQMPGASARRLGIHSLDWGRPDALAWGVVAGSERRQRGEGTGEGTGEGFGEGMGEGTGEGTGEGWGEGVGLGTGDGSAGDGELSSSCGDAAAAWMCPCMALSPPAASFWLLP